MNERRSISHVQWRNDLNNELQKKEILKEQNKLEKAK